MTSYLLTHDLAPEPSQRLELEGHWVLPGHPRRGPKVFPVLALTSVALRAPSVSAKTGYLTYDAGNILRCATIHPKVTFSNCATGRVSRILESSERDSVLGDLAEAEKTGGQALRDLLGLVVRRQAALWGKRLLRSAVGIVIGMGLGFCFANKIYGHLAQPLIDALRAAEKP